MDGIVSRLRALAPAGRAALIAAAIGAESAAAAPQASVCQPWPGSGCIRGFVWDDADPNGVFDPHESGLANVEVQLSGPVSHTVYTDGAGAFEFPAVPFGDYQVTQVVTPGCTATDPPPAGIEDVTVSAESPDALVSFPNGCGARCRLDWRWTAGPAIELVDPIAHWPSGEALRTMRPGDVLALSMRARDDDYMVHACTDCRGDSSVVKWGRFEDAIAYDWTLGSGSPGALVRADALSENTILYKIPECGWGPDSVAASRLAVVSVEARNEPGKAADPPLTGGTIAILMVKDCEARPGWIRVTVVVLQPTPRDDEIVPEPDEGTCDPVAPVWTDDTGILQSGIQITEAPRLCPDYVALLSVTPVDADAFELACADPDPECPTPRVPAGAEDVLTCEWSLVSGDGEFPLGTLGQVVAFRRSRSQGAVVKCVITDSGTRFPDPPRVTIRAIGPAKPVRAFVGIGDVEPPSYRPENTTAANIAEQRYAAAGYAVTRTDSVTRTAAESALADPCVQAFWVAGHATTRPAPNSADPNETELLYADGFSFNTPGMRGFNNLRFGCDEHPFVRELPLMGCCTSNPVLNDLFVCPKLLVHKHELRPGPTSKFVTSRTPTKLERKYHFPPPPHDLSKP